MAVGVAARGPEWFDEAAAECRPAAAAPVAGVWLLLWDLGRRRQEPTGRVRRAVLPVWPRAARPTTWADAEVVRTDHNRRRSKNSGTRNAGKPSVTSPGRLWPSSSQNDRRSGNCCGLDPQDPRTKPSPSIAGAVKRLQFFGCETALGSDEHLDGLRLLLRCWAVGTGARISDDLYVRTSSKQIIQRMRSRKLGQMIATTLFGRRSAKAQQSLLALDAGFFVSNRMGTAEPLDPRDAELGKLFD